MLVLELEQTMPEARLIIKKRPRGEYEIGTYTEDGSIVAHVSLRDGGVSDPRTEAEREEAALEQATRLVEAFERVLAEA
jgi:glycine/D-amino acid oxidase-like deaminating enzyme